MLVTIVVTLPAIPKGHGAIPQIPARYGNTVMFHSALQYFHQENAKSREYSLQTISWVLSQLFQGTAACLRGNNVMKSDASVSILRLEREHSIMQRYHLEKHTIVKVNRTRALLSLSRY